ncbi:WD repeat- and FYVE domain-containing protein 4 [Coregonus clupeaformis]|uniref:WD repeat- and FYVE domain-containing protein 4 n=1 Tax=Coregonus clupeaformis TaxID=59861 RepID=UPI001BDFF893|nr:WD repeat- and FYVE domain-containing protein 4 [Coregonus clupeaformis]
MTLTQEQMGDMERINKETGELSASGELAAPLDLKEGGEKGERGEGPQTHPLLVLREMLQQMETHTHKDSKNTSGQKHTHTQKETMDQSEIDTPLPLDQREEHLLRVLPLYIQVCESGGGTNELDLRSLAALTADTVVSNIHDILAEKPAEEARYEVQQFFQRRDERDNTEEIDNSEIDSRETDMTEETNRRESHSQTTQTDNAGWLLLKTLSLLTATNSTDLMSVVKPGLPAALVKCLYLLVCLPARKERAAVEETFQELFIQVLLQLCSHPSSVEEMVETQELQCLIISLTSLHDQTSAPWRHQASRVLRAVSAAKTPNTVPFLQAKNCVRICIQNLQRISDRAPAPVLAEVAVTVFSFIRDSYQLNPALFTELENNDGYTVLQAIMTRCEEGVPADEFGPVEDLLSLLASLCLFGRSELKVALCVTNPQPPGFKFDPSLTTGSAVRNLSAFRLLQGSFQRSEDCVFCSQILSTIRTVWSWNRANFFLLEWTVQSLAQLAQCVSKKPPPVHRLFFSMLEMVAFHLNYIPHEAMRAVQAVLKQDWAGAVAGGAQFGVAALGCFHRLIVRSGLLAEVLSDGGLLELLLGELRRRAKILRKARGAGPHYQSAEEDNESALTTSMLRVVAALTLRSIRNTVSVRDLGMVPYIKIFLDEEQYRGPTLSILEQLSEINPDEFMSTAIGALCSSTQQELGLKQDLLQSVLKVLESPNSWGAFRRAGGFTGLLSLVVDMEGALGDPPQGGGGVWGAIGQQGILDLLFLTLHTLALAVHVHPVNSHQFQVEGFYERLAEALLQLGCFQTDGQEATEGMEGHAGGMMSRGLGQRGGQRRTEDHHFLGRNFHQFLELSETPAHTSLSSTSKPPLPRPLQTCIKLLSYLDQFATGTFAALEKTAGHVGEKREEGGEGETQGGGDGGGERLQTVSPTPPTSQTPEEELQGGSRPAAHSVSVVCSETNYRFTSDQTILHPGAIRVIMTLLPHVFTAEDPQLSVEVQYSVAHHLQVMVKSEKNRQIVCEGGLVSTLLTHCRSTLLRPDHPLHLPDTRILEKISSHSISHIDLRRFLCLSDPLMCQANKIAATSAPESNPQCTLSLSKGQSPEEADSSADSETTTRSIMKTFKRSFSLLSSLPPIDSPVGQPLPLHQIISLVSMTSPRSFRPHRVSTSPAFVEFDMSESGYGCLFLPSLATVKGVNADSIPTGGIGGDCRGFPPAAGLTYSCWFLISRFSSACDSHPLRLLSVVRHMSRAEQQYVCLSVSISASDGCLVISTEEEPFTFLDMMEPEVRTPSPLPGSLRFKCSSQLTPGQWHHLAVVMAKDVKKSCKVMAHLNGKLVGAAKMLYIQPFPGQYVSMEPTAVIDVCAFIGTPSLWKQHASLVWRVGPIYLFEEVLSPGAVAVIYNQGTAYLGNYLALRNTGSGTDPLPFRLVPEERISFGINPAVATLTTVAEIRESYNEVDCRLIAKEMGITSRDNSTPVFLSQNISHHLTGTARTIGAALVGHFGVRTFAPSSAGDGFLYLGGPAVILSLVAMATDDGALYAAVKVLLSVLETSPAMQREMTRINGYKLLAFLLKIKSGVLSSRTFQLVLSLSGSVDHLGSGAVSLHNRPAFNALLCDLEVWKNTPESLDLSVLDHLAEILKSSSGDHGNAKVMHNLGLVPILLFLLADPMVTPRKVKVTTCIITRLLRGHFTSTDIRRLGLFLVYTVPPPSVSESSGLSDSLDEETKAHSFSPARPVWVRNQLLSSLCDLISSDSPLTADKQKELIQTLGIDWFLLFLQPHLHPSSLCLGLRLLTLLLANQSERNSFREGVFPGTLVESLDEPSVVMDNLRAYEWSYECLSVTCAGFDVLQRLLVRQAHLPQVYGALAALLLGKRGGETPGGQLDLDEVLQAVIDSTAYTNSAPLQLCSKSAAILLELVKAIITRSSAADASWELQFPGSVMQFLCLVHNHHPRDPLWTSPEFLHTLASTVFPPDYPEGEEEVPKWVCQPTRKPVCDFIRILLMDSLLNVPAKEHTHTLLLLLEYSPEGASLEQRQIFQTELLEFFMEIIHMTSQEDGHNTHLNTQESNSQRPEGQMATLMENMVFFSQKCLEKLYSGMFLVEPESLLTFLADQIVVVLEKSLSQKENTVSSLYTSTNRALLYFLSRPQHTQAEQEAVISTLQVVMARWDVVMATYNANVNFITCLLHCLLLIRSGSYPEGFGCERHKKHHRRILSHLFSLKTSRTTTLSQVPDSDTELMSLVECVWSKILTERRTILEDTYKIELSANQTQRMGPVSMSDISPLWEETALKVWQLYTDNVKRKLTSTIQRKHGVISSAIRSVHKRLGRETGTVEEFLSCMETHLKRGQEMFEKLRKNHTQLRVCEWERLGTMWLRVEEELLRERGVFGPGPGVVLTRGWVQDAAEGPNRTRPRIRRRAQRRSKRLADMCVRNGLPEESRGRTETDSESRILFEPGTEAGEEEEEGGEDCNRLTFFPILTETTTPLIETCPPESTTPDPCSHTHTCSHTHIVLQELEPEEEVKAKMCVVVVSGLSVTEGLLLFGRDSLYMCEGFTLTPAGDVCCRKHHPSSVHDAFVSSMLTKDISSSSPSCKRWPYQDIRDVHFMRFLLEENALEIFMQNGYSAFLVFFNKDHVSAFKRLCSVVPALTGRGVVEVITNARKTPVMEKTAQVKWQRGEISNFDYLMHLNTLAGRTYSDLMQYPVFPWVLADYKSETLDLTKPATFRDLSKPMGAQTEKRRDMFIQRFNEVENSEGDLAVRCHYCTHYSSAIIVSSFLVRMEPFSHTFLTLQGGYDIAERMFHSVKKEWDSASRDNMSDVRELIPEFYYLPDFLVNTNHFKLGCMQDGTTLGDVVLPPWAKGDPQEFIRVHREALESEYVSSHLHLWIDLIFGHCQRGPAAVESLNTFHPYFYARRGKGTGGQDALTDPLIKSTIQGYVNNFGQVPKQLFTKPHPPRSGSKKEGSAPAQPTPFFFRLDKLKPSVQPFKELLRGPVGQVVCVDKEVLVVEKNRLLIPPLWNIYFSWGFPDNSCSFGHYTTEKTFAVCESVCDWGEMLCAACPNQATIVTAGTSSVVCVWDVSISKDKLTHMKLRQALYGHTDAVTCLAVSEVHGVIASGSRDLTCILWDLEELNYVTQLPGHKASITALAINDLTGEIASCAGPVLYLWSMKGQLLTWLDTSCGSDVTSCSSEGDILSLCFTQRHEWDPRNVIVTGCADGIVRIWRTEYTRTSPDPPQQPMSRGQDQPAKTIDGMSGPSQSWERHLVLCRPLNRIEAVSRRRYKNNPAVTALAMSRTHATLLVGDGWGRVFTWTCE